MLRRQRLQGRQTQGFRGAPPGPPNRRQQRPLPVPLHGGQEGQRATSERANRRPRWPRQERGSMGRGRGGQPQGMFQRLLCQNRLGEAAMRCMTLLSIGSIQTYVFRSNRLRENAGASECILQALEYWRPEQRGWEVVFVAPDKAALIFPSEAAARDAVFEWSRLQLDLAPGLRLDVAHAPFEGDDLDGPYQNAKDRLRENEDATPFGAEPGALPVVRACQSTGLAAAHYEDGSWLSHETFQKRQH